MIYLRILVLLTVSLTGFTFASFTFAQGLTFQTGTIAGVGSYGAVAAKAANPPIPPLLVSDEKGALVPLVDLQGKFLNTLKGIGGKYVKNEYYESGFEPDKSVDVEIAIKLKEENKAFRVEKYTHSYPNCWRTDKPILYYPLNSWFIKVTDKREDAQSK